MEQVGVCLTIVLWDTTRNRGAHVLAGFGEVEFFAGEKVFRYIDNYNF